MTGLIKKFINHIYADITARVAYRLILNRPIDIMALKHWKNLLVKDKSRIFSLINSLFMSVEYNNLIINRPDNDVLLMNYIHFERCKLVKGLPDGDFIVDLGGAAPNNPRGDLLNMGYPHKFDTLLIVDKPINESLEQRKAKETYDIVQSESGEIRYHYGNMCEINELGIKENSVDLFWMGQSVEHIKEEEFDRLLGLIYKYLRQGGYFCFDTPNRLITSMQLPDKYIHPEHKIEYFLQDLVKKLKKAGFEIVQMLGIGLAEEVIKQNRFLPGTIIENISINQKPEHSYIFYFKTQKEP